MIESPWQKPDLNQWCRWLQLPIVFFRFEKKEKKKKRIWPTNFEGLQNKRSKNETVHLLVAWLHIQPTLMGKEMLQKCRLHFVFIISHVRTKVFSLRMVVIFELWPLPPPFCWTVQIKTIGFYKKYLKRSQTICNSYLPREIYLPENFTTQELQNQSINESYVLQKWRLEYLEALESWNVRLGWGVSPPRIDVLKLFRNLFILYHSLLLLRFCIFTNICEHDCSVLILVALLAGYINYFYVCKRSSYQSMLVCLSVWIQSTQLPEMQTVSLLCSIRPNISQLWSLEIRGSTNFMYLRDVNQGT